MTARRNIYLIYKEAINNIAKYAGCRQVHVQLIVLDGFLWLVIRDDGDGFDLNHPKLGNGLNSMRQRAETLGGSLLIRSEMAKGTELRASFEIATISDRMPG
jgi:signal transduction histidine kinase